MNFKLIYHFFHMIYMIFYDLEIEIIQLEKMLITKDLKKR